MKEALLSLAPSELRMLAGAIRAARLGPEYRALSVSQIINPQIAETIARSLEQMSAAGVTPVGVATCLELLADAKAERPRVEDVVEVVTTGPEAPGIANRSTAVVVADLFRNAKNSVLVAGYAVYQGQKVFQALAERMLQLPNLRVRMYLDISRRSGDTTAPEELIRRFIHTFKTSHWPDGKRLPEIYYDPRSSVLERTNAAALHAKCVVIDGSNVFVSSANFTEAAQQRNIEIGLLLKSSVVGERVTHFLDRLVEESRLLRAV